jgi:alkylated DNA nucleotide flippase Atl1
MKIQSAGATGVVLSLFWKPHRGAPMEQASLLQCIAGYGIQNDVNAHKLSPRQVLITLDAEIEELSAGPGALRENMVVALEDQTAFRPGASLIASSGVEIALTMYCEPCKRIAHIVPTYSEIMGKRGILGRIVRSGTIGEKDSFSIFDEAYDPLQDAVEQRFFDFVRSIPRGRVVRYIDVTIGIGVADSFVRAMPGYIRRASGTTLPLHRIVDGQGRVLDYVSRQAKELENEGVALIRQADLFDQKGTRVDLGAHLWLG